EFHFRFPDDRCGPVLSCASHWLVMVLWISLSEGAREGQPCRLPDHHGGLLSKQWALLPPPRPVAAPRLQKPKNTSLRIRRNWHRPPLGTKTTRRGTKVAVPVRISYFPRVALWWTARSARPAGAPSIRRFPHSIAARTHRLSSVETLLRRD